VNVATEISLTFQAVSCENLHFFPYLHFPIARNLHSGLLLLLLFPVPSRDPKLVLDNVGATEPDGDGKGVEVPKRDGSFVKEVAGDETGALGQKNGKQEGELGVPNGVGGGIATAPNGLGFGEGNDAVFVETFVS
jgi:hypothetical protein